MPDFSSPIDTGLPGSPVGVPDEFYDTISGIYNAIKILQQKIGDYAGLGVLDPNNFITQLTPVFKDSIQVQRMTAILAKANTALIGGQLVFLRLNGGVLTIDKADASAGVQRRAHGWIPNDIANGDTGIVYLQIGYNGGFAGMTTAATYYLSASTPGGITTTKPSASGTIAQEVGTALSATDLFVSLGIPFINP